MFLTLESNYYTWNKQGEEISLTPFSLADFKVDLLNVNIFYFMLFALNKNNNILDLHNNFNLKQYKTSLKQHSEDYDIMLGKRQVDTLGYLCTSIHL